MDRIKHLDDIVEAELSQSRTPRGSLVPREQLMGKEMAKLQLENVKLEQEAKRELTGQSNGHSTKGIVPTPRKASLEEEKKFGEFLKMINSNDAEKNSEELYLKMVDLIDDLREKRQDTVVEEEEEEEVVEEEEEEDELFPEGSIRRSWGKNKFTGKNNNWSLTLSERQALFKVRMKEMKKGLSLVVTVHGYMHLFEKVTRLWKKRWFVLQEGHLHIYKKMGGKKLSTVELRGVEFRNVEGDDTCFEIRTDQHSLVVCAYTGPECLRWKNEITRQDLLSHSEVDPYAKPPVPTSPTSL